MFRTRFILDARQDLIWFLGLPFAAVAFALATQQWLSAVALASVNLWITIPHHFATWLRTYGIFEDRSRWKDRLVIGPVFILVAGLIGLKWAPFTTLMLVILWDHQHSIMQQFGFGRIYDFKAQTGTPYSGRFDLALHWILFGNMLLTSPLFGRIWLHWFERWGLTLSSDAVRTAHTVSWTITAVFLCVYLGHIVLCLVRGGSVNPAKYCFIAASYFLWYFTAFYNASILVWSIAHRLMHGLQYIVITYSYTRRKEEQLQQRDRLVWFVVKPGHVKVFVTACLFYALVFQLIMRNPLSEFGFGLIAFQEHGTGNSKLGLAGIDYREGFELYSIAIANTVALTHYYFDSFIWKVRDAKTQQGL